MKRRMYKVTLKWFKNILGDRLKHEQDIAIHPFTNGKIVINYSGAEGDIDGYNNKYVTLSESIVSQSLGAVVRCGNPYVGKWDISLRKMLGYTLSHALEICGSTNPEVYLMGFSAGAGAISILAWEYPEVSKILLMAPAIGVGEKEVIKGLSLFRGEVYIVIGNNDEVVKPSAGQVFFDYCINAKRKELTILENCDHQFKGEVNGRIMSQAPFYAFLSENKPKFPDPTAGIVLYR